MQLKGDINLGTIVPLVVIMLAQTAAFATWIVRENNEQNIRDAVVDQRLNEMRAWQNRQDVKITQLSTTQGELAEQQTRILTLLEYFKEEWNDRTK